MKLDRLIAKHQSLGRKGARVAIARGDVLIDGMVCLKIDQEVDRFRRVNLRSSVVQSPARQLHIMVHKPLGVVSATSDIEHRTVVDLIDDPDRDSLHLVGRLDRNTSGLVLLTNDGRWSKRLMAPKQRIPKVYRLETLDSIPQEAILAFRKGFYFHTEDLITLPAELEILGEKQARLTLYEGRYHQIKRMFHRIDNRVVKLHREQVGNLKLPANLPPGQWRHLTQDEIDNIQKETGPDPSVATKT